MAFRSSSQVFLMHNSLYSTSYNCCAMQVHADYLASFQRMQTQFGNGNTGGINTYDPNTLQLKVYEYGSALNSGEALQRCLHGLPLLISTEHILQGQATLLSQCRSFAAAGNITPGSVQALGGNMYTFQMAYVQPNVGDYWTVRAFL